jgi:hypothetical protein
MSARALHYECIDIFESLLDTPADPLASICRRYALSRFFYLILSLCDSKIGIATCSNFPLSKGKPAFPTAAKTS